MTAIDLSLNTLAVADSIDIARGADSLAVDGTTLLIGSGFFGGFSTVDISNPATLLRLGGQEDDLRILTKSIAVPNANSVLVGGDARDTFSTSQVQKFGTQPPTITTSLQDSILNADDARGLAQAGQFTVAALGDAGVEVLNFLPPDANGLPPTVFVSTVHDADTQIAGVQAIVGSTVTIQAAVTDDVQVGRVDLFLEGERIGRDLSAPFELSVTVPASNSGTVTLMAEAVDTGGNVGTSNALVIDVASVTDIDPPVITSSLLRENDIIQANAPFSFEIRFSEAIAEDSLTAANFFFEDDQGNDIVPTSVSARRGGRRIAFNFPGIAGGDYTFVINAPDVTDEAGNALGATALVTNFRAIVADAVFISPAGGDYNVAANWSGGAVPGANEVALLPFDNVPVHLPNGQAVRFAQLINRSDLIAHGTATVNGEVLNAPTGSIQIHGNGVSDATLTVEGNITNLGVVELDAFPETIDDTTGDDATLVISGGTLDNEAGGIISTLLSETGALNARRIRGDVVNRGTVAIEHTLDFDSSDATLENRGTINTIAGDLRLLLSTLAYESGTLAGPGRINLANEATLALNDHAMTLAGLTIVVQNDSIINGLGDLTVTSGTLLDLRDATINVAVINEGNLLARTGTAVLNGLLSNEAGGVLEVRGDDVFQDATLTANAGIRNLGRIELSAIPGFAGDASGDDAALVSNLPINNEAGGVIAVLASTVAGGVNGRQIHGDVVNRGTLQIESPLHFDLPGRTLTNHSTINIDNVEIVLVDTTVVHQAGTITGSGTIDLEDNATVLLNGDLTIPGMMQMLIRDGSEIIGGSVLTIDAGGFVDLRDGAIKVATTNAGRVLARTVSAQLGGTFVNDDGGLLEVRGDETFHDAKLTVGNTITNRGTIELEAEPDFIGDSTGDDATIEFTNGQLANEAGGVIVSLLPAISGAENARRIDGDMTNRGTVQVEHPLHFSSPGKTLTNHADIDINAGDFVFENTNLIHEVGTINGPGDLNLSSAATLSLNGPLTIPSTLTVIAGGGSTIDGAAALTINGGGLLDLRNGTIDAPITNHGDLLARTSNALLTRPLVNQASGTIEVRGDAAFGDATLTVSAAIQNRGRIELNAEPDANDGSVGDDATLIIDTALLTNDPGGTIVSLAPAAAGATDARRIRGDVENRGTLQVDQTLALDQTGKRLTNHSAIQINAGGLNLAGTTLLYAGGSVSGPGDLDLVDDATLTLNAALTIPDTLGVVVRGDSKINGPSAMTIASSGLLDLQDGRTDVDVTNLGRLLARTASAIANGMITNESGGLLEVRGDDALGDATLTVNATLTNRGTIEIEAEADANDGTVGDDATLAVAGATLENEASGSIKSLAPINAGVTDLRRLHGDVNNQGTIQVDQTLLFNRLNATLDHSGTLALNAGQLDIINATVSQNGGVLAGPGDLDFEINGTLTLNTDLNVTDTATVLVRNSSQVNGVGTLNIDQGGLLDLQDGAINVPIISAGGVLARTTNALATKAVTIESTGLLEVRGDDEFQDATFTVNAPLVNRGTIELEAEPGIAGDATGDDATLVVSTAPLTNAPTGTIKSLPPAISGFADARIIDADLDNQGAIEVDHTFTFNQPGKTLTHTGRLTINFLDDVNISNTTLRQLGGTVDGLGILDLRENGTLTLDADLTIDGEATLLVRNTSQTDGASTLTIGTDAKLDLQEGTLGAPLINDGSVLVRGSRSTANAPITNNATALFEIRGDSDFDDVTFTVNADLTNHGRLDLESIPSFVGSNMGDDVTLIIDNGTLINETLGRVNSELPTIQGSTSQRTVMAAIDNRGTITANRALLVDKEDVAHVNSGIIRGSDITITGLNSTFETSGAVTISPGRTLTVPTFTQTGGTTTVDGSLLPATLEVDLSGGRLEGSGLILASVTNSGGIVGPGSSAGRLRINGSYDQELAGTLEIEIGGSTAFSEYDVLSVSGIATLDGTLELSVIDSFEPVEMETFQILSASVVIDFFSTVNGTNAPNNLELTPIYNADNVTINVAQPLRLNGTIGAGGNAITLDDIGLLRQAAISLWADAGISQDLASVCP